jgi:HSP20 family protein
VELIRDLFRFDPFQTMAFSPQALERQEALFVPEFEVRETPEAYIFKADLPGVGDDEVDITIDGNRLVVSGRREIEDRNESDRFFAYERAYGTFTRSFTLPDGVDTDNVRAGLDRGVLTLTIPKRPERHAKKVEVKAGGEQQERKPEQRQQTQQQQSQQPKAKA